MHAPGRYGGLVLEFLRRSKGGPLAWATFMTLQEHLRMEQINAREQILRDELIGGHGLPGISELAKDAKALMVLLGEDLPAEVPAWLEALAGV